MGIAYDPTIPSTGGKPGAQYISIRNNFANLQTLIDVDHADFSSAHYGTHDQVTFGSNNPPSLPTSFPIFFTNTQDGAGNTLPGGIPQPLLYNGTASQSKNQYLAASSGSALLLCGIIIKWGSFTTSSGSQVINLPNAFPNNIFSGTATAQGAGASDSVSIILNSVGQITIYTKNSSTLSNSSINGYYFLIGN